MNGGPPRFMLMLGRGDLLRLISRSGSEGIEE